MSVGAAHRFPVSGSGGAGLSWLGCGVGVTMSSWCVGRVSGTPNMVLINHPLRFSVGPEGPDLSLTVQRMFGFYLLGHLILLVPSRIVLHYARALQRFGSGSVGCEALVA